MASGCSTRIWHSSDWGWRPRLARDCFARSDLHGPWTTARVSIRPRAIRRQSFRSPRRASSVYPANEVAERVDQEEAAWVAAELVEDRLTLLHRRLQLLRCSHRPEVPFHLPGKSSNRQHKCDGIGDIASSYCTFKEIVGGLWSRSRSVGITRGLLGA